MSTLEIMVFVTPVLAGVGAIGVGFLAMWLNERAERRKWQRRAGE